MSAKSVDLCTKHARLHNKTILVKVCGGVGVLAAQFKARASGLFAGFQVDNKPNSGLLHFKLDKF